MAVEDIFGETSKEFTQTPSLDISEGMPLVTKNPLVLPLEKLMDNNFQATPNPELRRTEIRDYSFRKEPNTRWDGEEYTETSFQKEPDAREPLEIYNITTGNHPSFVPYSANRRRTPYTDDELTEALANPRQTGEFVPPSHDLISYLWKERVTTDLPPSQKIYEGPWYPQADNETTCVPWAIVNAAKTMGSDIDADALKPLIDYSFKGAGGVPLNIAVDIGSEHIPELDISLDYTLGESTDPEIVREQAKKIKDAIDLQEGIVSLVVDCPSLATAGASHVVCLGGYVVHERGVMDVQVIDSLDGSNMQPLEDVINEMTLMRIRRRAE